MTYGVRLVDASSEAQGLAPQRPAARPNLFHAQSAWDKSTSGKKKRAPEAPFVRHSQTRAWRPRRGAQVLSACGDHETKLDAVALCFVSLRREAYDHVTRVKVAKVREIAIDHWIAHERCRKGA